MRTLEHPVGTRSTTRGAADAPSPSAGTAADPVVVPTVASLVEQLRGLLGAAADMDDADGPQAVRLRSAARRTTGRLVAAGVLPTALVVEDTDAPVVVARLLGHAWRHATRSSS